MNYVAGVFIVLTLLLAGISLHFYSDKVKAEDSLGVALDAAKDLKKNIELKDKSCAIDSSVSAEYQTEKSTQEKSSQAVVEQIANLPKSLQHPNSTPVVSQQKDLFNGKQLSSNVSKSPEVDIDGKLPADLIGLLNQGCHPDQGGSCVPSR